MEIKAADRILAAVGNGNFPPNVDKAAMISGLNLCAQWYRAANRYRTSKMERLRRIRLSRISKTAKLLERLLADDDGQKLYERDSLCAQLGQNGGDPRRSLRPRDPWWKGYFGVRKPLRQVTKGALVFLPVGDRRFALSFGFVFHNLKDESYEYDFGLRVTLNSLDPNKLKSTDVLQPGAARRQRTQVPVASDLTYFDFDRDNAILKSLTGKVKDEHKELFKDATGASSLHISSTVAPDGLIDLCEKLLELYESDTFKTTFPDIQNITPVRDPAIIERLNDNLLAAFRGKSENLSLAIPAIIDYHHNAYASFSGAGTSLVYDDFFIGRYYEYLDENDKRLRDVDLNDLKRHSIRLTDEDGNPRQRYSIYNCLIFDTTLGAGTETYHLVEGNWYKVESDYIARLKAFLDPLHADLPLPPFNHDGEGAYNEAAAAGDEGIVCLDKGNISPAGQTQVEPCDLYAANDGHATFNHIKVSTFSAELSHLFNQGANAIELLKLDGDAVTRLKALITEKMAGRAIDGLSSLASSRIKIKPGNRTISRCFPASVSCVT